jgi:hypothetical protein
VTHSEEGLRKEPTIPNLLLGLRCAYGGVCCTLARWTVQESSYRILPLKLKAEKWNVCSLVYLFTYEN